MKWPAILALALLAARTTAADPNPYGRPILAVDVAGAPDPDALRALVPLRLGDQLTQRAISDSIRALYSSSRLARVAAMATVEADGVRIRFLTEPTRRIGHLDFIGARALGEQALLRAADLPSGTEFSPRRVTQAAESVARAYYREGFHNALVRWDAAPGRGETLRVDFSLSEGDPTLLSRLEFAGDIGLALPVLASAFDLRPGDRLRLDLVDDGLAELHTRFRRRGFYRASLGPVRVSADGGYATVHVPIDAGPQFTLQVRGNRAFDDATLLARLRYDGSEPLDASMQRELAERLKAFHELAGFPHARVTVRESAHVPATQDARHAVPAPALHPNRPEDAAPPERPSSHRLVTFLVTEGEFVRATERRFDGVTVFRAADLLRRIDVVLEDAAPAPLSTGRSPELLRASWVGGAPRSAGSPQRNVEPREVFAQGPYRAACREIVDLYKALGFLDAQVGPARLERTGPGTGRVVIPVVEGRQTLVSEIRFTGVERVPEDQLWRELSLREGDPLSFFAVEESRAALTALYQAQGYFFAQVEDDEEIDEEAARARILFRVTEGPLVRASRLEFKGLSRTSEYLVRDALTLTVGDPITPRGRQQSAYNLLKLGLFSSAMVELSDPQTVAADKALVVEVREKPSFEAELRAGFSLVDGLRVGGQVTRGNLFGRNHTFSASAKLNWPFIRYEIESPADCETCRSPSDPIERRLNLSYALPWYRRGQTPIDLRGDLVHENVLRPAYQLTRYAGLVSLHGFARSRLGPFEISPLLQMEVEFDDFARRKTLLERHHVTMADRRNELLPQGNIALASLRPSITLDARDDHIAPMSGMIGTVSIDLSRSFSAYDRTPPAGPFDIHLLRALTQLSTYLPLYKPQRIVLALSAQAGTILKKDGSRIIGTKRFFLGGTQSLRGFNEDGLVPQDERKRLHAKAASCRALLSGIGCDEETRDLLRRGTRGSEGGEFLILGRGELRFGVSETLDGALFLDAGNLWLNKDQANLTDLRYTAGAGLRLALPIGPAALDVGFNLSPDQLLGESILRVHLSVGLL